MRAKQTLTLLLLAALPRAAQGAADLVGTRALGLGGALRGAATGDAGLSLNPSGMGLIKSYALEGAYQLAVQDLAHAAHVSVVDSTQDSGIAAGLYYTFLDATKDPPAGVARRYGHEVGGALSFPAGDRMTLGLAVRYLHIDGVSRARGLTGDVGLTLRLGKIANLGLVGYNLRDLSTREAPMGVGYGVSVVATDQLLIVADGMTDFTTYDAGRGVLTSGMGGLEYLWERKAAFRAGGGWDAFHRNTYIAGGLSLLSEDGAIDLGVRQDVLGPGSQKATLVAASLRVFITAK